MHIQSLIDFIKDNKLAGIIMFIDFEKAYDSVYWEFLVEALRCFNFGDKFIKWIKILYNDLHVKVRNGNLRYLSKNISCELSYYNSNIFTIFKKLLNLKLLKIGHVLSLLGLFSDDICIFLEYDRGNLLSLEK